MITIRQATAADDAACEALLDAAFGSARRQKASERLRAGRLPAEGLSLVASKDGRLIGTVRLWHVTAGPGRPVLFLGPLAVAADMRNRGIGSALMEQALHRARRAGFRAVLLVGDAPFYGRFGFSAAKTAALRLPGHDDRQRLLAHEFVLGALDSARGLISATGKRAPQPAPASLVARAGRARVLASRAA
jgi:predicted N-acetyltransferase YhbS